MISRSLLMKKISQSHFTETFFNDLITVNMVES